MSIPQLADDQPQRCRLSRQHYIKNKFADQCKPRKSDPFCKQFAARFERALGLMMAQNAGFALRVSDRRTSMCAPMIVTEPDVRLSCR
jgi:hypothetical protein